MKILVLNGPNLNMLGIREPDIYGKKTYDDLCQFIMRSAEKAGVEAVVRQTNYEGQLVTWIQEAYGVYDAIIINAAAYTHTSIAILDALKAVSLPTVEVHLSEISERESFRHISFVSMYAEKTICGHAFEGYAEAISYLVNRK